MILFSATDLSRSLHLWHAMPSRPCPRGVSSSWRAASSVTEQASRRPTDRSDFTRVAFSRVKSPPTCRSNRSQKSSTTLELVLHIRPLRLRAFVIGRDVVDAAARKQQSGEHGEKRDAGATQNAH